MIKKSPQLSHSNHQISQKFLLTGVILFLIGLFLPHEWSQTLDILGARISAVATGIPSVKKAAAISPISELVRGFFGIGILLLPFIYAFIFGKDPIRLRFKYGLDKAESKLKFFGFIYCLGLPALAFVLYLIFFWPGEIRLGITPTRGQAMLTLMLSYRITLAFFGTLVILATCAISWLITVFLLGPSLCAFERKNDDCKRA